MYCLALIRVWSCPRARRSGQVGRAGALLADRWQIAAALGVEDLLAGLPSCAGVTFAAFERELLRRLGFDLRDGIRAK